MTRVALIACDHGLGHVRRSVLVAEALASAGADVTLLAPGQAVRRVRRSLGVDRSPSVSDRDFATLTTPAALRRGDPASARWEERLPDLAGFGRVVCDTLPEVLAVRPDAVLVAQFLWHDVLEGVDRGLADRAADLVAGASLVIGSEPFVMPAVRSLAGFRPVGLHVAGGRVARSAGRDLLVSGGTTPALVTVLRRIVDVLVARGPGPYARVLVDRALLPVGAPGWMVEATHDPAMFRGLAAAIVRPGLGVLTELLVGGVPAWCLYEAGNAELAHNAGVVERLGAGRDLQQGPKGDNAIGAVLDTVLAGVPRLPDAVRSGIDLDGSRATARLILGG